jgi:outer membrane protein assembly factor BamA
MVRVYKILTVAFVLLYALFIQAQDPQGIADDRLLVEDIVIDGNKVTKDPIILRELLFEVGDTILKMEMLSLFQRSKDNLLNLALFNFVFFDVTHLPGNRIVVQISVVERWYIWPVPILEYAGRNLNEFINNRDWDKIVYGAWLKWNNFRGWNELLTAKIRLGYINEYALSYKKPNLGRRQRHGINVDFNMNQQNEVIISTVNNKPVEYQPMDIPTQTVLNASGSYFYRRKIYTTHTIRFGYQDITVSDSVAVVNTNFLGDERTHLNFFTLSYHFFHDVRDSKVYPLEGFAVRIRAEQMGLGFIKDFPYPSLSLTGVFMWHQKLANRFYFYNTTKARYTQEKYLPYALNRALGYNENLSGYEPYVIDGSDYFITKYNVKLQVIKPTTQTIPLIGMEQFNKIYYALYLNVFADAGYVNNLFPAPTNTMVNNWQFSAGIGVDLVTYYDQVLRVDFAVNRYGEYGFFFHLRTPFYGW